MNEAREKGLVRWEGKEYIMKDGDIVLFKFNVQDNITNILQLFYIYVKGIAF